MAARTRIAIFKHTCLLAMDVRSGRGDDSHGCLL